MSPNTFLRHVTMGVMAAGILALSATDAHATHFRYGTIKWRITDPVPDPTPQFFDLQVTAECAWRRSFYSPPPNVGTAQNTGQTLQVLGTGFGTSTPLIIDVTAVNLGEDWFVGSRTFNFFNIPRTALTPFLRVFWNGNARISTLLDGNADDNFNVEARLSPNQTNLFGPVSSLLPIVNVAHGQPAAHFFIPAVDPEGDTLTWTISSTARSSLTKAAPDGADDIPPPTLTINSSTGEVTWDTASELVPGPGHELYAVQFIVSDSKGGEAPVDALLRLVPNTSQPPVALINDSPNPALFEVNPGTPVSFVFKGTDPDVTDTVTLAVGGGMPGGATFTPTLPFTGVQPQSSTFNWTPTLANVGSHVISLSVTDNFALQDTTSATITVLPNFQPDVICPADHTMEATGPTTPYTAQTTVDDPEGQAMTVKWYVDNVLQATINVPATPDPTTIPMPFAYTVAAHPLRVEVSDGITNTVFCNATITVVDTTPPDIDTPPNQLLEATSPAGAMATWSPDPPTAMDLVDGPRPVTCNHASGETFPIFPPPPQTTTTIVTCTSSDLHGNTATETFNITVQDTTPPAVTPPGNIVAEATSPAGAVVLYPPATAFDIVDGNVFTTCAPASGSLFPLFPPPPATTTTTVNCEATDVHGNTGHNSFTVTIQDTTPPDISNMPANIIVVAPGPAGAVVTWPSPTAFDIVDLVVPVTCVPPSGSLFPVGTTTVVCTASDIRGNTSSESFTVTVLEPAPDPCIILTPGVLWPPNHKMVNIDIQVVVAGNPVCAVTNVTSTEPVTGHTYGRFAPDWIFSGLDLQLRSERYDKPGRTYGVTVTCTGSTGSGTTTANILVPHDQHLHPSGSSTSCTTDGNSSKK